MKGARLFVDRKEELQRHLEAEKEPKVRLKLACLNAFSSKISAKPLASPRL